MCPCRDALRVEMRGRAGGEKDVEALEKVHRLKLPFILQEQ